jgi:hypothetical protein
VPSYMCCTEGLSVLGCSFISLFISLVYLYHAVHARLGCVFVLDLDLALCLFWEIALLTIFRLMI